MYLQTNIAILEADVVFHSSHCNSLRTGVMLENLHEFVTMHAALF